MPNSKPSSSTVEVAESCVESLAGPSSTPDPQATRATPEPRAHRPRRSRLRQSLVIAVSMVPPASLTLAGMAHFSGNPQDLERSSAAAHVAAFAPGASLRDSRMAAKSGLALAMAAIFPSLVLVAPAPAPARAAASPSAFRVGVISDLNQNYGSTRYGSAVHAAVGALSQRFRPP